MSSLLPKNANLSHLKKQAKDLRTDFLSGDQDAKRRFLLFHPKWQDASATQVKSVLPSLHDAQWVIAREYGFESWPKLHAEVSGPMKAIENTALGEALEYLKRGKMVILFDDEGRENKRDFVLAAEKAKPEAVNFITRHGRGTSCLALAESYVERLQLPLMSAARRKILPLPFPSMLLQG